MTYEPKRSGKTDNTIHRRIENSSKSISGKDSQAFDIEKLQNSIRSFKNEVIGLKKTNLEGSYFKGYFRNQCRQNSTASNKTNPPPDVAVNEEICNTIRAVISIPESFFNQESNDQ